MSLRFSTQWLSPFATQFSLSSRVSPFLPLLAILPRRVAWQSPISPSRVLDWCLEPGPLSSTHYRGPTLMLWSFLLGFDSTFAFQEAFVTVVQDIVYFSQTPKDITSSEPCASLDGFSPSSTAQTLDSTYSMWLISTSTSSCFLLVSLRYVIKFLSAILSCFAPSYSMFLRIILGLWRCLGLRNGRSN